MRNFIFTTLFLATTIVVRAQTGNNANYYHYNFQIHGVTNLAEAKEITDDFRALFKTYPTFNDSTDTFEFISTENIAQAAFDNVVTGQGNSTSALKVTPATSLEIKNYLDNLNEE